VPITLIYVSTSHMGWYIELINKHKWKHVVRVKANRLPRMIHQANHSKSNKNHVQSSKLTFLPFLSRNSSQGLLNNLNNLFFLPISSLFSPTMSIQVQQPPPDPSTFWSFTPNYNTPSTYLVNSHHSTDVLTWDSSLFKLMTSGPTINNNKNKIPKSTISNQQLKQNKTCDKLSFMPPKSNF